MEIGATGKGQCRGGGGGGGGGTTTADKPWRPTAAEKKETCPRCKKKKPEHDASKPATARLTSLRPREWSEAKTQFAVIFGERFVI